VDYDHYTDACVELAVDLINDYGTAPRVAAGHGDDPVDDLAAFLRDHGLDDTGVTAAHADAARRLADRLHAVFTTDHASDAVAGVNAELTRTGPVPQISGHDDADWHLHYRPTGASPVDRLAAVAAMGLATALVTGGLQRFGRCDGLECRDVYVDVSRNNRRRFCGDGCANLAHVTAHRARQRDAGTDRPQAAQR
jgi:predicted RNA-binding Zn ribbon-like protein